MLNIFSNLLLRLLLLHIHHFLLLLYIYYFQNKLTSYVMYFKVIKSKTNYTELAGSENMWKANGDHTFQRRNSFHYLNSKWSLKYIYAFQTDALNECKFHTQTNTESEQIFLIYRSIFFFLVSLCYLLKHAFNLWSYSLDQKQIDLTHIYTLWLCI